MDSTFRQNGYPPLSMNEHLQSYMHGPELLRRLVSDLNKDQLDATPIPGTWSTRQVICHISDFEIIYADRMKRVIAEVEPAFFGGDPDIFAQGLKYSEREVEEELQVIDAVRRHMGRILRTLTTADFERIGHHSENGPITLAVLLQNIAQHLPHHLRFIQAKIDAM